MSGPSDVPPGGAAPFQDHFSQTAEAYAAFRPSYPPELADFLASIAPRHDLAWDCGCGSGQLAVPLAEHFARVVATDASAEQLRHAAPHSRVAYHRAAAEASALPGAAVDLAVAAQAAHWFDLPAYYAEVRRVARPGAIVAQTVYNLVEVDAAVDAAVRRFYDRRLAPYWPPERRHVETDYRSIPFPFPRVDAPSFAMRASWTLDHFIGYVRSWSGVQRMERALGPGQTEAFRDELAALWGPAGAARAVRWPLTVRAGRV